MHGRASTLTHKVESRRPPQTWVPLFPVGVATGRCVSFNGTLKTCEVAAWCPVEDDTEVPK